MGHCDEWRDVLREMRDCTVRLAIAHRRTIRSFGRIHKNIGGAVAGQPLITARRGIALDTPARRAAVACSIEKSTHCNDSFYTRGEPAEAGDTGIARAGTLLRRQSKCHIKPVGRQERTGAVWPLNHQYRALCRVLEADFGKLSRAGQSIEIGVDESETWQHIRLR